MYRSFGFPNSQSAPEASPIGWPLGDPAYELDRHQTIRHSRDWCRLIAVLLHKAAVPVSASICRKLLLIAAKTWRERLGGNVTCRKAVIRETTRRSSISPDR